MKKWLIKIRVFCLIPIAISFLSIISCTAGILDESYYNDVKTEEPGNDGNKSGQLLAARFSPIGAQGAESENFKLTEASFYSSFREAKNSQYMITIDPHKGPTMGGKQ